MTLADEIEAGGGTDEFRAKVLQGKVVVAQVFGRDLDWVWAEGERYLAQYATEGTTELQVAEKRKGRWRLLGGAVDAPVRAVEAGNA